MSIRETVLKNLLMNKFGFMDSATLNGSAEAAPKPLQVISGSKPAYIEKLNAVQLPSLSELGSSIEDSFHSLPQDEFDALYKWPQGVPKNRTNLQRFALYHEGAHAEAAMLHGSNQDSYTQARSTLKASFEKQKARVERHARRLGRKIATSTTMTPKQQLSDANMVKRWAKHRIDTHKLMAQFAYRAIPEEAYADQRAASLLIPKRPLTKLIAAEMGLTGRASSLIKYGHAETEKSLTLELLVRNANRGKIVVSRPYEAKNIYFPIESNIDKALKGRGVGKRAYWELLKSISSKGQDFIFSAGENLPFNVTSKDASRVWQSKAFHRAARRIGVKMVPYMSKEHGVMFFATNMERHHAETMFNAHLAANPQPPGWTPGGKWSRDPKRVNVIHKPFKGVKKVNRVKVPPIAQLPRPDYMNETQARWFKELSSGQVAGFFLKKNKGGEYNVGLAVGHTSSQVKGWWNGRYANKFDLKQTGKAGIEALMFGKRMMTQLIEGNVLEPGYFRIEADDSKRFFAYMKGLKKLGFKGNEKTNVLSRVTFTSKEEGAKWFKTFGEGGDVIPKKFISALNADQSPLLNGSKVKKFTGDPHAKFVEGEVAKMADQSQVIFHTNEAFNEGLFTKVREPVRVPSTAIESSINNASKLTGRGSRILSSGFRLLGRVLR